MQRNSNLLHLTIAILILAIWTWTTSAVGGCSKKDNIVYLGNTLKNGKKTKDSEQKCADWCAEEPDCKFWSFDKTVRTCRIKTTESGGIPSSKYISPTKTVVVMLIKYKTVSG